MIDKVSNTWTITDYNWPIDNRKNKVKQEAKSFYLFDYRDELYKHVFGGKWNLYFAPVKGTNIDIWA